MKTIKIIPKTIVFDGFTDKEICEFCKELGLDKGCPKKRAPEFADIIYCSMNSPCG